MRLLDANISAPNGITLRGFIKRLEERAGNEIAEARRDWPKRCECDRPRPTHATPEEEFAWCECRGYVRVLDT